MKPDRWSSHHAVLPGRGVTASASEEAPGPACDARRESRPLHRLGEWRRPGRSRTSSWKISSSPLLRHKRLPQTTAISSPLIGTHKGSRCQEGIRTRLGDYAPPPGQGSRRTSRPPPCRCHRSGGHSGTASAFFGDLPQVSLPVRLVLVQGPGECRGLFPGHLCLSLGPHGLGLRGLLLGPLGLRPGPFGLPRRLAPGVAAHAAEHRGAGGIADKPYDDRLLGFGALTGAPAGSGP